MMFMKQMHNYYGLFFLKRVRAHFAASLCKLATMRMYQRINSVSFALNLAMQMFNQPKNKGCDMEPSLGAGKNWFTQINQCFSLLINIRCTAHLGLFTCSSSPAREAPPL